MTDFEDTLGEDLGEENTLKPEPVGKYFGERNNLGERHGHGWAILPNGDQYDGEYRRGIRHGKGLYVFKDGSRYFGNYRCGVRSGLGKFIYPDGTTYDGNWHKNEKHGKGTYIQVNGDIYSGDWYKGKRHGVGTYTWKDLGVTFEGTWNNGVRVGPCIVHYNKFKFHGCWDLKYPQGPGVFSFDDKHILRGYYKSDNWLTPKQLRNCENRNNRVTEEDELADGQEEGEADLEAYLKVKPSKWVSQTIDAFHYSLLPQHPVPLSLPDDCQASTCDLDSVHVVQEVVDIKAKTSLIGEIEEEVMNEGATVDESVSDYESYFE